MQTWKNPEACAQSTPIMEILLHSYIFYLPYFLAQTLCGVGNSSNVIVLIAISLNVNIVIIILIGIAQPRPK